MTFAKKPGTTTRLTDHFAEDLLSAGIITPQQLEAHTNRVCGEYFYKDQHPEQSPEDIYAFITQSRYESFGAAAILRGRALAFDTPADLSALAIDQRDQKERLLQEAESPLFILTQPELFSAMAEDLQKAKGTPRVLVSSQISGDLATREELEERITTPVRYLTRGRDPLPESSIFFYGEEGLLHCRSLSVDAVVTAVPNGYHAQALCNLLGQKKPCVVYIPKGLDIIPCVPLTSLTELSFYHLAKLCRDHGREIYDLSRESLYERYPRYFLNIYDTSDQYLPLTLPNDGEDFLQKREKAVEAFLNGFSNIRYKRAFFEEENILVHSIRVTKAKDARVISCPKGVTPREKLQDQTGTALVSNFLFFLTPKLGTLYNDLRADRPCEQADAAAGHLDYKLEYREGKRIETFPLFQKACIGCLQNGEFIFFPFRLGGGQITVQNTAIRWEKDWVDPEDPGDICLYTPMYSKSDEAADRETYRKVTGAGRVNFVILQDRITCIRKGNVILPSVGVVLSLSEKAAEPVLKTLTPLENGYYAADISVAVRLDPPASVSPETWEQVKWVYGGGLSLICDGEGLCDGEDMLSKLSADGWMTPLSRQTQESVLHKLAKHPRTAIGTAKNGDLVILVYSGRTKYSSGADYREMIELARNLYPDIWQLMNADGGGSAVLGLSHEGSFMELSIPATSTGSCVGMVRPISTLFYIPAEKEN